MKISRILVVALLSLGLVGCKDDTIGEPDVPLFQTLPYKIIEEKEVSAATLFNSTMGKLEGTIDQATFDAMKSAFNASSEKLLPLAETETKSATLLYKTVKINYQTTDQDNQTVTASALIVYPLLKKMDEVMLINHGTQIGIAMIPTKYTSVEAIMAATGALCILPDYIGLGSTSDHPDLYLNEDVHGRTSVDALLALLQYAKDKKLKLASNYKSYILGYSQGGAVSLASLREVQRRDAATQASLHLQKVYCGDGPYDLRRTFETYVEEMNEGKDIALGSVIPLVINSMFNSYPSEFAAMDMNYEDFFTEWALSTGVPQAVQANDEDVLDMIVRFNGVSLDKILNFDYCNANPDKLEFLLSTMDRQNLCKGWEPEYSLKLLHCNPDGVVPFSNFEEATQYLNNDYVETQVVSISESVPALLQHIYGMLVMVEDVLDNGME